MANQLSSTLLSRTGERIAYRTQPGNSPHVVFLSGYKSDMLGTKAAALAEYCGRTGRAFTRFDYSGHGESDGRLEDGTISGWLQNALDVIEQTVRGDVMLVGSSMGGWIAFLAALKLGARVKGIVGIAAAPDFTERLVWAQFSEEQKQEVIEKGVVYLPSCYGEDPYPFTRGLIEDGRKHLLLDRTLPIHCPVRLLHGMRDEDVPWRFSCELTERLDSTDVEVTLIKDGNHRLSEPGQLKMLCETLAAIIPSPFRER